MANHTHFTDFLNDRQFVIWQMMADETLDIYWKDYFDRHPEVVPEAQKAISLLQKDTRNRPAMSESERDQLLGKILTDVRYQQNRRKARRSVLYALASAAAIFLLFIGLQFIYDTNYNHNGDLSLEPIVGNMLNKDDIQVIAGDVKLAFQDEVHFAINQDGMLTVIHQNNNMDQSFLLPEHAICALEVPYGKQSKIVCADGTTVWINSGTVLNFPVKFASKKRELTLVTGEIYADVAKNKKKAFYVHTPDFNVKVYGTKFNITNYHDSPQSVVLVEGSVSLQAAKGKETFLLPKQLAVFSASDLFKIKQVEVESYISWIDKYLILNNTDLEDALTKIGRYYKLSVRFDNDIDLQDRTCTGKIYLSDKVDNVLNTIAILSSTTYKKMQHEIIFSNK